MPAKIAAIHVVQASNPLLAPSPGLMIWTLVTFGITLYVLRKYVFPPVAKAIETRRVEISQSIDEAERSRDEALQLLDEYKARLSDAHKEADALRERGRKDGERRGAELVASAEEHRERVLVDQSAQLDAQARQAASGLRDGVVDLAIAAAEKATRGALTAADHRRLIEEALTEADLSKLTTA
jgi:F-type H+-transporting ATPase subunit b